MKRFILIIINVILLSTILYADEKFILIIDPGHGGKDPGCIGQKNVKEKDVVLDIALKLGNYIENNNKDVKVVYTRKTDIYLTLKERARIANKNKGDLFISIHADAIPAGKNSSTAYGAGTFTMGVAHSAENLEMAKRENTVILLEDDYQTSYASFDPKSSESYIMFELLQGTHQKQSFQIAQSIQKELTTRAKRNNRDVRQAPILVLKEASMPSVLVEVGFLSNINEERFLNSQDGRKTISDAIYHGFVNYKKNYEKKSQTNVIARTDDKKVEVKPTTNNQPAKSEPVAKASMVNNSLVYKIQILSDTKLHKKGSAALKGLWPVEYYKEGNVYKYTYGESKNRAEMNTKLTTVKKKFNDAFVIKFENGKRVK